MTVTPLENKIAEIMHGHQVLDDYHHCKCGIRDEYWWEHVAGVLMSELGLNEMPEAPGYYMTEWVRKSPDATRSGGRLFSMRDPARLSREEVSAIYDLPSAAIPASDYEVVYVPLSSGSLRIKVCKVCGSYVWNAQVHEDWHAQ